MSTSATASTTSQPSPDLVLFARGVIARLSLWSALRLAVDQSWGGVESAQKRTWMASVVVDAFDPAAAQEEPDDVYVEESLLQMMADEFDAVIEDGSAESVAKDVVSLWASVKGAKGDALVLEWEEKAQKLKGQPVESQEGVSRVEEWEDADDSEGDDDDDEPVNNEAPQLLDSAPSRKREELQVDEDGFTLVTGKDKSRR